jgi:peptidoglycan/xylan/chitin deacetylase (PgdA/CDA1 family)
MGMPLTSVVKRGTGAVLTRLGLLRRRHRGRVLILAYHRVLPADALRAHPAEPGMYVTDAAFRRQMAFVTAHYQVLSMDEWLGSWSTGGLDPGRQYCLITFDDGWRDNYEVAFPILRELGLPATIFLATRFIGTADWFWSQQVAFLLMRGDLRRLATARAAPPASPWSALRGLAGRAADGARRAEEVSRAIQRLKRHPPARLTAFCRELGQTLQTPLPAERACLTWEEVAEMSAAGVAFGSHTATHAILTGMPDEAVRQELQASRRALEAAAVRSTPVFCYPNGDADARVARLVRAAGYAAAVTTRHGVEALTPTEPFALRRVGVHEDIASTAGLLGLRLVAAPVPSRAWAAGAGS